MLHTKIFSYRVYRVSFTVPRCVFLCLLEAPDAAANQRLQRQVPKYWQHGSLYGAVLSVGDHVTAAGP